MKYQEKKYPIYIFRAKWSQDGKHDPESPYSLRYKGLPEGRVWNSTVLQYYMYKTEQNIDKLKEEQLNIWWPNYIEKKKDTIINPRDIEISVEFFMYETWCAGWFSHYTFDDGRTNEQFIQSFRDFVYRMENLA